MLSAKHAETGRLCDTFRKMAEEEHLSRKDLGLSRQEYTAMLGTIEWERWSNGAWGPNRN